MLNRQIGTIEGMRNWVTVFISVAGQMSRVFLLVGSGSVMGMGSVVTKDIPPDEVWIGNPAQRLSINRVFPDREFL